MGIWFGSWQCENPIGGYSRVSVKPCEVSEGLGHSLKKRRHEGIGPLFEDSRVEVSSLYKAPESDA